jgi:hypothetical protein
MGRTTLACLLFCLSFSPELLAQRQLHWDALDVEVRLDDEGRLHVTETHTMVFSGDWNGGERTFNVRPRQQFAFVGMERIDPSGEKVALGQDSSLDDVDEYVLAHIHDLVAERRSFTG